MQYFGKLSSDKKSFENRITSLFNIQYPIIQAGMIWASGWRLASGVSQAGGLGIIGAGSMYTKVLEEHIIKCKQATNKPFGVNLPLLYPAIEQHIAIILKHQVPIVFTSAGNPKIWTKTLKDAGITVVHVVSSAKFALKCQEAGVDAVVAEGFEAGGHNGRPDALCRFTTEGFRALSAMDPTPCRPFSADRGGMNLGEGAAYLVLSWLLIPFLGMSIATSCLAGIVYALSNRPRWNGWFNPQAQPEDSAGGTNWLTIGALVLSLLMGTIAFMGSLAFGIQRYFEYQVEEARKISQ